MPSATLRSNAARSARGNAAQAGKARRAACTAASTSAAPPAEISAIGCSSMGEMSVKVSAEATRSPPIQCRVSTVTPSTVAPISWASAIANPISPSSPDSAIVRAQTY